jgi:hypothetical protein
MVQAAGPNRFMNPDFENAVMRALIDPAGERNTFSPGRGRGSGMPWKESSVMDERIRFVIRLKDGESMVALCREFQISRKTGYKFQFINERSGRLLKRQGITTDLDTTGAFFSNARWAVGLLRWLRAGLSSPTLKSKAMPNPQGRLKNYAR